MRTKYSRPLLLDLLGKYENSLNWNAKSLRRVDCALFPFIESLGHTPPSEIWLSDVRDYIRSLDAKGQAPTTLTLTLNVIYGFLTWMAKESELGKLDPPVAYLPSLPKLPQLLNRELNWELLDE